MSLANLASNLLASHDYDNREHARMSCGAPVTVIAQNDATSRGWLTDLGEGGFGADCAIELAPGDEVRVQITLPAFCFSASAVVRHTCGLHFGCEFFMFTPEAHRALSQYIVAQTKHVTPRFQLSSLPRLLMQHRMMI
jgi:hypothetical protein